METVCETDQYYVSFETNTETSSYDPETGITYDSVYVNYDTDGADEAAKIGRSMIAVWFIL